ERERETDAARTESATQRKGTLGVEGRCESFSGDDRRDTADDRYKEIDSGACAILAAKLRAQQYRQGCASNESTAASGRRGGGRAICPWSVSGEEGYGLRTSSQWASFG